MGAPVPKNKLAGEEKSFELRHSDLTKLSHRLITNTRQKESPSTISFVPPIQMFQLFSPPPSLSSRLSVAPRLFVAIRFDMRTRVLCFRVCPLTRLKRIALASLCSCARLCRFPFAFFLLPAPSGFVFCRQQLALRTRHQEQGASPGKQTPKERRRRERGSKDKTSFLLVLVLLPRPFAPH